MGYNSKWHRYSPLICIWILSLQNLCLPPAGASNQPGNIKVSNQTQEYEIEMGTVHYRDIAISHVGVRGEGWHYRGLWFLSLARNGLLSLGYQPSPVTPQWSSRAVLLFHYHRGSRSMERRHHYPSGLMRLSCCRKGQAITAGAVFSLEMRRGWRGMEAI